MERRRVVADPARLPSAECCACSTRPPPWCARWSCGSPARCRCTSAARPSTARPTSATAGSRSCSTCSAATSSGPGSRSPTCRTSPTSTTTSSSGPRPSRGRGQEITERCEAVWYRAMDAIDVKRPTHDPHATAYVEQMVALVDRLVDVGIAYETSDGVYFQAERDRGLRPAGPPVARLAARRRPGRGRSRRSARRSTSRSGRRRSRASRRGRRRGATGGRAGTPSAS